MRTADVDAEFARLRRVTSRRHGVCCARTSRIVALAVVISMAVPVFAQNGREPHWVTTWATALVARAQTAGGDRLRVVLSNAFGTAPLDIGTAHVALRDHDAASSRHP